MFACSIFDKKKYEMIELISFSGECVALLDFSTNSIKIIFSGTICDPEWLSTVPVSVEFSSFPFKNVFLTLDKLLWFAIKERSEGRKEGKESRKRRTKKK